jgi:hypothetical protein
MLKYCYEKWNKNKDKLEEALRNTDISRVEYRDLLVLTVDNILNDGEYNDPKWNTKGITEINDGDYQGTLLYLIPEDTYQPSEYEYLMTYIGYGSCTCCDLLQSIQPDSFEEIEEDNIAEFMALCKDFITNMIKPYNHGWRNNEDFEQVTMEE